jgi:uncharacterized membrane protein
MGNHVFTDFFGFAAQLLEALGVCIILGGIIAATIYFLFECLNTEDLKNKFSRYRLNVARGILLGLEFLVAADIIETVLVDFTLDNVIVLALIVLIRTFLSYSLEVEIEGKWPWQQKGKKEIKL